MEFQTQAELIDLYPPKTGVDDVLNKLLRGTKHAVTSFDSGLDSWLSDTLNISSTTSSVLRVLIYLSPIALISILLVYLSRRKKYTVKVKS